MSNWMEEVNNLGDEVLEQGGGDYQPIPDGWYQLESKDAVERKNKSNDGSHLSVVFTVLGGPHEGRLLWENFNIDNPNPTAQQIGLGELKRFMAAGGLAKLSAVEDLNGLVVWAKVATDRKDPTRNLIKAYRAEKPEAEAKAEAAKPTRSAVPAKPVAKPWARK